MRVNAEIIRFITEEVSRQGFRGQELIERSVYMAFAWDWAMARSKAIKDPDRGAILKLGMLVEPGQNRQGFRHVGVRVGSWIAPEAPLVPGLLETWLEKLPGIANVDLAYKEFEEIHPFADGNGRVGKILHNWLRGSLDRPVLVKDFFGRGVP